MASCFVAAETATLAVAGYYTLAVTSVPTTDLPLDTLKRMAKRKIAFHLYKQMWNFSWVATASIAPLASASALAFGIWK